MSGRNIHFIALKINEKIIEYLKMLNEIFINRVIDNLNILSEVEEHFVIQSIYYRLQDANKSLVNKQANENNKNKELIQCILQELRRQIWYYPSVHRDKNLNNKVIVLAGGKSEVNYYIGLNRKNMIYVELKFGPNRQRNFNELWQIKDEICDKIDYLTEFDIEKQKIGTYICFNNKKKDMLIKQIARVVDKYIRFFSQYTFPNSLTK